MIRDSPCDDPLSWAGIKASKPSTFVCCLERWYAAALPIAPRPTTITSNAPSTVVRADASWLKPSRHLITYEEHRKSLVSRHLSLRRWLKCVQLSMQSESVIAG